MPAKGAATVGTCCCSRQLQEGAHGSGMSLIISAPARSPASKTGALHAPRPKVPRAGPPAAWRRASSPPASPNCCAWPGGASWPAAPRCAPQPRLNRARNPQTPTGCRWPHRTRTPRTPPWPRRSLATGPCPRRTSRPWMRCWRNCAGSSAASTSRKARPWRSSSRPSPAIWIPTPHAISTQP